MLVPWCLKRHFVRGGGGGDGGERTEEGGATPPLPPGAVVDESRNVIVLQRYCHVHARGEVEALLEASEADGNWISVDLDGYRAVGEEGKKEA